MRSNFELLHHTIQATVFYLAPRLSNVILFILISWYFGPRDAGIYTLGVTFLLILNVVTRGIDDLIVRECAQAVENVAHLFVRFSLLRLVLAIFLYGILWISLTLGFRYGSDATNFILVMALVAMPEAIIATCQSIFVGLRDFKQPSWIIGTTNLVKLIAGSAVIIGTSSLMLVAWSAVVSYIIGAMFMAIMLAVHLEVKAGLRWPQMNLLIKDLRRSLPFMGITGLIGTEGQLDVVILSIFQGEQAVGWYGAATTVTSSFSVLSQAYRQSVYPVMAQQAVNAEIADTILIRATHKQQVRQLYKKSIQYLALLSFPIAAGLVMIAPSLVHMLFGNTFAPTITILQILAVSIPFSFLSVPNSRLMFSHNAQRYLLVFVAMAFVLNIGLNLLLTPSLGSNGAAIARTLAMVGLFLCSHLYSYFVIIRRNVWREIIGPLSACGIMSVGIWLIKDEGLFLVIATGICVYIATIWLTHSIPREDLNLVKATVIQQFQKASKE